MSAGAKFAIAFFLGMALVYLVDRFPLPGALIACAAVIAAIIIAAQRSHVTRSSSSEHGDGENTR